MTNWRPQWNRANRPIYEALANALARDIQAGRLAAGDRLPPQRELAEALGVTVPTVTRAYSLAARRGLVGGQVGRGTFVRPPITSDIETGLIDLSINALPPHAHLGEIAARLDSPPTPPAAPRCSTTRRARAATAIAPPAPTGSRVAASMSCHHRSW